MLNMSKKLLDEEHPETLRFMGNLARNYSEKGKLKEAEQLEVQVLDMRKQLHGAEHPHTLQYMANLASTYANQGNIRKILNLLTVT